MGEDSFEQTSLKEQLENEDITDLIIVGARTEFCIAATCRAAIALGFHVTLIGHTTVDGDIPAERVIQQYNETLSNRSTGDPMISVVPAVEILFSG